MQEEEFRAEELLESLGIKRIEGRILIYLSKHKTGTFKDIEDKMGLRQPEVSIGVRELYKMGWLNMEEVIRSKGKGRPQKVLQLRKPFRKIVDDLKEGLRKEQEDKKGAIIDLLELTSRNKSLQES